MNAPFFSVIIPTWNKKDLLADCLNSLLRQTWKDFDIMVVDNGSQDGTAEYVRHNFPRIKLLALEKNWGFGAAVNRGIAESNGQWIALLNNDAVANPEWLTALAKAAKNHPQVDCFASKILCYDNRSLLDAAGDGYGRNGMAWNTGRGLPDGRLFAEPRQVFSPCAAAAAYRREFFQDVGLFDEDFFAFYEDVDLGFRGQLLGKKCLYVPDAMVLHRGGATAKHLSAFHLHHCSRNALLVVIKNMPAGLILKNFLRILLAYFRHFGRHLLTPGHRLAVLGGYGAALKDFPKFLAKRRVIQKSRRIVVRELEKSMQCEERFLRTLQRQSHLPTLPSPSKGEGKGGGLLDVSIIIVHYKTEDLLGKCLERLAEALSDPNIRSEIFVVDNDSSAEKMQPVRGRYPQVHSIMNADNVGFAKACNQALRRARGMYCLLLNPDCLVSPNTIGYLLARMEEEDPRIGLAGPRHIGPDKRMQPTCRAFPTLWNTFTDQLGLGRLFPHSRIFNSYRMSGFAHDETREVDQLMGSCLLIRKKVLEEIGLMDEDFFLYFEEVDLCWRAKKAGWKIVFFGNPAAEVMHEGGASSRQDFAARTTHRYRSLCLWMRKHRGPWAYRAVKATVLLGLLLRGVIFSLARLLPDRNEARGKASAHWKALRDWPSW